MFLNFQKVIRNIPRAMSDPGRALKVGWRRLFPYGIKPKDTEAYRIGSWSFGDAPRVPLQEVMPGVETVNIQVRNAYDRREDLSLDAQEVLALCSMVARIKPRRVLEVGTSDGNTTLNLLLNAATDARITTIDLPENWAGGEFQEEVPELMRNVTDRRVVGRQYKESEQSARVDQVYGDSAAVDFKAMNGPFQFAFIDGCHHYNYVKSDTRNVLSVMEKGGVIVWHDYGMIEDVSRGVDELRGTLDIKVVKGTRLAVARV